MNRPEPPALLHLLLAFSLVLPAGFPGSGLWAQAPEGAAIGGSLEGMHPRELIRSLKDLAPAQVLSAPFQELSLTRDAGRLRFSDGTVALLEIQGQVVGAVVDGPGTFEMTPPEPVERWQISRFFDEPVVRMELEGAYLLFADSTLQELQRTLAFQSGQPERRFSQLVEEGGKYVSRGNALGALLVRTFINGEGGGFFHAHLIPRRGDSHYFRVSSFHAEEIDFGRRAGGRGDEYEVLSSFHREEDYPEPDPTEEADPGAYIMHYQIEAWLDRGPDFSARTTAFLSTLDTQLGTGDWIPVYLSTELELDSLRWDDGSEVIHDRGNDNPLIWIQLPQDPGFRQFTAWYHGKVVEYRDLFYWFEDPTGWYPQVGRTDATFDMTFHVDRRYQFLASGTRTETVEEGDMVRSRWVVETPESQASFNVGEFKEHSFEFPGIPPVRLHVNEDFHSRLYSVSMLLQEKNVADAVSADLASALSFFQDVYGPLDVKEFNASEVPYAHGQAFPSLIHLSALTFLKSGAEDKGENEAFRAHEVAHQWWGLAVEPRSYRDHWLSEGMAEFSGLWYMQVARFDPDLYFRALEKSRDRIFDRRGRAGPISLGTRVAIGSKDEDYQTIIYEKGAWVIHMLRNLFMDLDTMDETAFKNLMRDVSQRFRNRRISTREFQSVVEEHLGHADMQWFFDQWVHGTDLPTYRWAWTGEEVEDGYKVTVRVRQEDVPEDFQMIVPVTFSFGLEGQATVRMMVRGPETTTDLAILPRKPDGVVFNDFQSVLARVREEHW